MLAQVDCAIRNNTVMNCITSTNIINYLYCFATRV